MRLFLLATASLLACASVQANAQSNIPQGNATAKCPYGEYDQDTVSVGASGVAEHRKGTCIDKPEPAVAQPEPQPPPPGEYDEEKVVMDEYGLTRRQARDWFNKGADRVEMPIQPMTHGPGTKEYEALQIIKKLTYANTLRDIVAIIGDSTLLPTTSTVSACMKKDKYGEINDDIVNVNYIVGSFNVDYKIVSSCRTDNIYISGKIIYSNSNNNTCIDYTDFNNAFESMGITRDEPWSRGFDKEHLIQPYVYSKRVETWDGPTASLKGRYAYPSYKTSKSCIDYITIKFGRTYR